MVGTDPAATQPRAPPIVLIHSANHGDWCWQRVVPPLVAQCHKVHAPTLTRSPLLTREVGV